MEFHQVLQLEIGTTMENGEACMRSTFEGLTCSIVRCYISQFLKGKETFIFSVQYMYV